MAKKTQIYYDDVKGRSRPTPEMEAKWKKQKGIKIGVGVGAGLIAAAGIGVGVYFLTRKDPQTVRTVKAFKSDKYENLAEGAQNLQAVELEITVVSPKDNKQTVETWVNQEIESEGQQTQLINYWNGRTVKGNDDSDAVKAMKAELTSEEISQHGGFTFQGQNLKVSMNADASHNFLGALAEVATQGDSLSNSILMKILQLQDMDNPNNIKAMLSNPGIIQKINLNLTSMELDAIIEKMPDKYNDVKQALSDLSYAHSQLEAQENHQQKTSNFAK